MLKKKKTIWQHCPAVDPLRDPVVVLLVRAGPGQVAGELGEGGARAQPALGKKKNLQVSSQPTFSGIEQGAHYV